MFPEKWLEPTLLMLRNAIPATQRDSVTVLEILFSRIKKEAESSGSLPVGFDIDEQRIPSYLVLCEPFPFHPRKTPCNHGTPDYRIMHLLRSVRTRMPGQRNFGR